MFNGFSSQAGHVCRGFQASHQVLFVLKALQQNWLQAVKTTGHHLAGTARVLLHIAMQPCCDLKQQLGHVAIQDVRVCLQCKVQVLSMRLRASYCVCLSAGLSSERREQCGKPS